MHYKIKILLVAFTLISIPAATFIPPQTSIDDFNYVPVEGKQIGIAPYKDNWTLEDYQDYKFYWGFNYLRVLVSQGNTEDYFEALEAGYEPEHIMVIVTRNSYEYVIDNFDAGFYFVSEPVEHDCFGNPSSA